MIEIKLTLGNDEARAFARELRAFREQRLTPKLTGEKNDRRDTATSAYVVAGRILERIDDHLARIRGGGGGGQRGKTAAA